MKISIILPTYNRAGSYLKRAIDSVVKQTYDNWELIIVDNNSIDNTKDLIKSYESSKIKTYTINNDGNIAKSRNLGIDNSTGDYLAFLDSDDYWKEDKLETCFNFLNLNKKYLGVCHSEDWVSKDDMFTKNYGPEKNFTFQKLLNRGNCVSLSAMIVKKSIVIDVNNFSENREFITAEDYDLWIKLAKNNNKIGFINKSLGIYQIHDNSESSNILRNTSAIINVINKYLKNDNKLLKNALSNCWLNTGKLLYKNNKKYQSLISYFNSIKHAVFNVQPYIYILILIIPYKIIKPIINKYQLNS
jgi:glycosyltransferase involved in cell wall biosynthesis